MYGYASGSDQGAISKEATADSASQRDVHSPHNTPRHSSHPQDQLHGQPLPQQQQISPHQQSQPPPQQLQQQRSVKRPRPVKSCAECRKRKLRCDRLLPCSQCQKSSRLCKYTAEKDSGDLSDGSDVEFSEPSRIGKRNCAPGTSGPFGQQGIDNAPPQPKNGDASGFPLLEELSLRMERLEKSLVSRSPAGHDTPKHKATAEPAPQIIRGLSVKNASQRTRYFGQSAPRVLLNLFDGAKTFMAQAHAMGSAKELLINFRSLHNWLQRDYQQSLTPITVFVDSMMPIHKRMTDILPKKQVCDRLVASYVDTSETMYRMLHLPTFSEQYNLYWEGKLRSEFFLPQLLVALSLASRFETKSRGLGHERSEGVHIPTACALVRIWLDGLRGKDLVELATLQVEVLLMHAMRMITPRFQDLYIQLGSVVRQAMTMGLHRDPSEFEPRMSVFIGEIRRRLWYTILDMDVHMALASNLPSQVREGDYSCRPPRNLDDTELYPGMKSLPQTRPIDQVTDNQMQVYAAKTIAVRLKVVQLVTRADATRDCQEILETGLKLERYLEDINHIFPRHGVLNDTQKSKQWRSRAVLDMHVRRTLLALYRPLAMGVPDAPAQISRAYLRSSMVIMKYLDELNPLLPHFDDVVKMYHQILKADIVQAALSVCYFIQSAVRPSPDGLAEGQIALRMSPDDVDSYPSYTADNLMLWSPSRLVGTVQKSLEMLMKDVSKSDCKDIICLVVVLESVKTANPKSDEYVQSLYMALDSCMRAANMTMDELASRPSVHSPADDFQKIPYNMHGRPPGMYYDNAAPLKPVDDLGGWIMWDGWE